MIKFLTKPGGKGPEKQSSVIGYYMYFDISAYHFTENIFEIFDRLCFAYTLYDMLQKRMLISEQLSW